MARADLFRQLCVAESTKYSTMPVILYLALPETSRSCLATDFHYGLREPLDFGYKIKPDIQRIIEFSICFRGGIVATAAREM